MRGTALEFEYRRIRLVYVAISLAVLCALLICMLIALAFIDAFVSMELAHARDLPRGKQPALPDSLKSTPV